MTMNTEIATLGVRIELGNALPATEALEKFQQAGARAEQSTAALDLVARKLNGILAAGGIELSADSLIRMNDEYTRLTAQLRLATDSQSAYAAAYGNVKRIAAGAQQDLSAIGALYVQVANATSELGISQQRVAAITEAMSLAMKVSGASASDSAQAQQQLTSAFADGALSLDQFNAINAAAPRLMTALAEGAGVSIGALQYMASEGQVTADIMAGALPKALTQLQDEMVGVQTIGGAFTVLKNNIMDFVGAQTEAGSVAAFLTNGISLLANNVELLVGVISTVAGAKLATSFAEWATQIYQNIAANGGLMASNIATAETNAVATAAATSTSMARAQELRVAVMAAEGNVALAVSISSVVPAEANAARGAVALTAANTVMTSATGAAAVAAGVLRGALALLGGPIGAIVTAVGLAATAWSWFSSKSKEAGTTASGAVEASTAEIIANIDKQNQKLRERVELAKKAGGADIAKEGGEGAERLASLLKEINALRAQGKALAAGDKVKLVTMEGDYQALQRALAASKSLKAELAGAGAPAVLSPQLPKVPNLSKVSAAAKPKELTKEEQAQKDGENWIAQSEQARHSAEAALAAEAALYGKNADEREREMISIKALAEVEKYLADQRKKNEEINPKLEEKLRSEAAARVEVEQATLGQTKAFGYAAQLAAENMKSTMASIADPGARAKAQLEADAAIWRNRIELAVQGSAAQKALQKEFDDWYATQSRTAQASADAARAAAFLKTMEEVDTGARQAAQAMEASFGSVGKAIGGLATALTGYARTQATIASQLEAAKGDAKGDQTKISTATETAARQNAQAQIKAYSQMATAAKGFFKENTTGYKIMEGAEKAFRAYETAMAIENMLAKSGLLTAFTSLFIASKATEQAADTAATGASVANSGVRASADGVAAVAKTAASVPFPASLGAVAAMIALLAGVGVAIAGGGGGGADTTAKDRQEAAGTGSVFGDSKAKSNSIAKSLELVAANSNMELSYTRGMLYALRSIESALGGLGNLLIRTAGLTGELAQGSGSGGFFGAIGNAIFGGKVTTLDTGLSINPAALDAILANGVTASQYTDTKKDGGWFSSDKYRTQQTALGTEANKQIAQVIIGLSATITEAGKLLGVGGAEFTAHLNSFVVDIGKISLKGLKGEEIQKQLEAVFSKLGDDMARFAVDGLSTFQKVGEGYFETLARIASNYANLDSILTSIGMKFGATGLASIAARENLISMAGGIDKLAEQANGFADNFLTEAERLAPVKKYVAEQLAAMGYASIDTREAFKQLVLSLNAADAAQGSQLAKLLDLQDAFAKVYPAIEGTTKSATELREQLNEAYEAEREAITSTLDRMNAYADSLKKFQDSLLLNELSTLTPEQRYQEAKAQFERTFALAQGGDEGAQSNLESSANAYLKASQLVNASGLRYQDDFARVREATTDALQWAEKQVDVARASLAALEKSVNGLVEVKTEVMSVAQAIRELSGTLTASQQATLASNSTAAIETLYQQLLGRQSDAEGLEFWKKVLAGGTSIAEIARLFTTSAEYQDKHPAMSAAAQPFAAQASPGEALAINLRDYGTANTVPLVEAIRELKGENAALTAEIRELRAEQQRQTGDAIQANYDANARGAAIVAEAAVSAIRAVSEPKRIDPI